MGFTLFLYAMVCFCISRYSFSKAVQHTLLAEFDRPGYVLSVKDTFAAASALPEKIVPFLCKIDFKMIYEHVGRIYASMAGKTRNHASSNYGALLKKSADYYRKSINEVPGSIRQAEGLASVMFKLEKYNNSAYDALPAFKRIVLLGPNIVRDQYMAAEYFYFKHMDQKFFRTISHLAKIWPPSCRKIKKAGFYSRQLDFYIKKGLEDAIDNRIMPATAHFELGKILLDQGSLQPAISQYALGLSVSNAGINTGHYIFYGKLLLKAQENESAFKAFRTALKSSKTPDRTLKNIYWIFKRKKQPLMFLKFCSEIEHWSSRPPVEGLMIARARIDAGLYNLARARLLSIIAEKENPEAFYLLAVTAEKEKNWDEMELNIQKATVLDPSNCNYYRVFAKSLQMQQKWIQAKIQQDNADQCRKSRGKKS